MLPPSSPLKCTSPSDVYLLLKSSDFINHDLSAASVFTGCADSAPYELELILRKWYPIDPSRELRCFVRRNVFVGELQCRRYCTQDKLTTVSHLATRQQLLRLFERPGNPRVYQTCCARVLGDKYTRFGALEIESGL